MANSYKNYTADTVTDEVTVITADTDTEVTVVGMSIANTDTSDATVNVKMNTTHILKGTPIPAGGAIVPIGGDQKVILTAGDKLTVSSDVSVDVLVSTIEKV